MHNKIAVKSEADARKHKLSGKDALTVLEGADTLYVAKGKKHLKIDLRSQKTTEKEILSLILGPSGNLRAPTIKVGKRILVGFSDQVYQEELIR